MPSPIRPATTPIDASATDGVPVPRHLLGIWAHPDDEAYLSADLMAQTIDQGGSVTLVSATYGELGFADDDPRTLAERSELRRNELATAMSVIGVADVRCLELPDAAVADTPVIEMARHIAAIIDEVRPDMIVTFGPDGITGHDDHIATGLAATAGWLMAPAGELFYAAKSPSWMAEWTELHDRFDIWMSDDEDTTPEVDIAMTVAPAGVDLDRKRRVLAGHHSQAAGLSSAFGESTYRRWMAEESFRRPTQADFNAAGAECFAGRAA